MAPLSGIQPAEPAKNWLKVILDQLVGFIAGPQPGWLQKNLWITLNNSLYSNGYRENYTEPVPRFGWHEWRIQIVEYEGKIKNTSKASQSVEDTTYIRQALEKDPDP